MVEFSPTPIIISETESELKNTCEYLSGRQMLELHACVRQYSLHFACLCQPL